jgi:signal transduction histidine kinase/HAMP domain-containing protein
VRLPSTGLGIKLNLSLLAFLVALGTAMALLILFGFRRSQHDATTRSREGLEAQGRHTLLGFAESNAYIGQFIVSQAVTKGHDAAVYMEAAQGSDGATAGSAEELARTADGALYDPSPGRVSDVWVPSSVALDPGAQEDVRDSSALDPLFPVIFAKYGQGFSGNDTVSVYYMSARGVVRSYPRAAADTVPPGSALTPSQQAALRAAGPTGNPQRNVVWSDPHEGAAGQGSLITAYTPVYAGDEFRGIVGVDLSLTSLVARADAIHVTDHGYAFVTDRNGNLLPGASHDIIEKTMADVNNREFALVMEHMRAGQANADRAIVNGEDVFVAYAPLGDFGGSLALVVPLQDVTAESGNVTAAIESAGNRTLTITLLTMLGFFVLALAASAWLNRVVLLRPIAALVRGTRAVASGDLDTQIAVPSRDELGDLAISFNMMTDEIRHRRDALRAEMSERERAQNELNAVFDAMTDMVLVLNKDGTYLRQAPTRAAQHPIAHKRREMIVGRTVIEILGAEQGAAALDAIRRALTMGGTESIEYSLQIEGAMRWYSASISSLTADSVVWVARDITERMEARLMLEQRVEERTRELSTLLDVSRSVSSTLEVQPLLAQLLEQIRGVAEFDRSAFMLLEGDALKIISVMGPRDGTDAELETHLGMTFDVHRRNRLWQPVREGHPVIIDDVRSDSEDARAYRAVVGDEIDTRFAAVRAWMAVPVASRERVVGMVVMSRREPGVYGVRHAQLATAIASQAAIAIENARLFEETQRRARETEALLQVSRNIATQIELQPLLEQVLDQIRAFADYNRAGVMVLEDGMLVVRASRDFGSPSGYRAQTRTGMMYPLRNEPLFGPSGSKDPVIVDDILADDPLAAAYRGGEDASVDLGKVPHGSYMAIPLVAQDRVVGAITLARDEVGYFTPEHARLARAMASQVAVAINNAQLFAEAQTRARETEALIRADERLFGSLDLDAVFQALTDVAVDVLQVDKCLVTAPGADSAGYVVRAHRNFAPGSMAVMNTLLADPVPLAEDPRDDGTQPPLIIEDLATADPRLEPMLTAEGLRSAMVVPIRAESGLYGRFAVAYTKTHRFSVDEQRLMLALADRAALAIENAQHHARAQRVASLEERQRLARDLHDSVSQALYGIALGARTARTLLDRDPASVAEPLEYVLSLADAGLAEMRALIFELRPESLETEGLVAAIEKQIAATRSRYGIQVSANMGEEPDASLALKEAFYRIAQEALHNTVKHAQANHIDVTLECPDGELRIVLQDDGRGFDPEGAFPGHLGLSSMRERAAKARAHISIESAPGAGTRIEVRAPLRQAADGTSG